MRTLPLAALLAALLTAPLVPADEVTAAPEPLVLYGHAIDPGTKAFELTPYMPDKAWYSPGVCALPDGFVPPPAMDCQRITYVLAAKPLIDLPLDDAPIHVTFWLSADFLLIPTTVTDAGVPVPVEDVGVIPAVNVEATLDVGGNVVATDRVERQNIVTGPDGEPTAIEFDLDPELAAIPAGSSLSLTFQWWQVEAAGTRTGMTMYNVHEGGDYFTTVELPTTAPAIDLALTSQLVDLTDACAAGAQPAAEKHMRTILRNGCRLDPRPQALTLIVVRVSAAFENPPLDKDALEVHLEGPKPAGDLGKPVQWTNAEGVHIGYVWNHEADGAQPADYKVHLTYDGAPVDEVDLAAALGLESASTLPGFAPAAALGALGVAAGAAARRRP